MLAFNILISAALVSGCALQQSGDDAKTPSANHQDSGREEDKSTSIEQGENKKTPKNARVAPKVTPILLFHGGGGGAIESIIDMSPVKKLLVQRGAEADHIHLMSYPHSKDIKDMKAELSTQWDALISRYPVGTKFDLIGHSLGHVVSLVTTAELGHLTRVRKLIGVAGVMFGQYKKPYLCRSSIGEVFCGDIFDDLTVSYPSPRITKVVSDFQQTLSGIEKCAVFSPDDGILDPYDSASFKDGKNISIEGVHHVVSKTSTKYWDSVESQCYDSKFE